MRKCTASHKNAKLYAKKVKVYVKTIKLTDFRL